MENLINIKSNWKHCTLEYLIKNMMHRRICLELQFSKGRFMLLKK